MELKEYVGLYRDTGVNITAVNGSYIHQQGLIGYSFPNLVRIRIEKDLVRSIQWKYLISILLTDLKRKNTYEFILDTDDYSIERFAKKIRNRIRKSLNHCTFKKPDLEDLLADGLEINRQTMQRQKRKDKLLTDKKQWSRYISSLYKQKQMIFLGAYYAGRMVGYIIAADLGERYDMFHAYIDRNDSEITNAMNGLLYKLVNQIIEEKGRIRISYGIDSFSELQELNRFKNNMLFDRVPVSRVYLLHPLLVPLVRMLVFYNLRLLRRRSIKSPFTRKLIRLYQGHRLYFRENNHK